MDQTVDLIPEGITFALLLTAAGAGIAASIITGVVAILTSVFPGIQTYVNGAQLAFLFSAILFVLAGIAVGVDSLDEGLVVFVAWLTTAAAAVGVHQVVARRALVP
jgi:hypothetical protein